LPADSLTQRRELADQRRKVDFDTYDVTVEELIRRVAQDRIEIAPVYQRQFRWDDLRQSQLIESILLGVPVPPLFMATNVRDNVKLQWEVVDGLQRLLTLVNFAGDPEARSRARLSDGPLRLIGLEKLQSLNRYYFEELAEDIQTSLLDRPLKVIVLNDKSDLQVRFDLFERLNTGGIRLTDQEVRECVYRGPFMDAIGQMAISPEFITTIRLPKSSWKDGTPEDYILRFFAFLERYNEFDHSVKEFLNDFASSAIKEPKINIRKQIFDQTFKFLCQVFAGGLRGRKGSTAVNLFEAVAVGAALALRQNPRLSTQIPIDWINSDELRKFTTGATNSKTMVRNRIEFCEEKFLRYG
jgi:Protein of unknown function DUF262